MILTDDQKNKYHQVWKEIFKKVNDGNGELILHEKINNTLIIHEKDNKFCLELALNCCLFEPYEIKV